jgi:hypothetical protein
VYSGGTYTGIKFPSSTQTTATGINASGSVAGYSFKGDKEFGFVYSGGAYATIDVPRSTDTVVEGINALGQVTGYYLTDCSNFGFIATPEAPSLL